MTTADQNERLDEQQLSERHNAKKLIPTENIILPHFNSIEEVSEWFNHTKPDISVDQP